METRQEKGTKSVKLPKLDIGDARDKIFRGKSSVKY